MSEPVAKGTSHPLGANYWKAIAGRAPRPMDREIQNAIICPDDDAPLEWPQDGRKPVCPHCTRKFDREDGILDIRPTKDIYLLSEEAIAAHAARENPTPVDADPAKVFGPLWPRVEEILGDVKGKVILDLCCGTGFLAHHLAARGAKVVALDLAVGSAGLGAKAEAAALGEDAIIEYIRADVCRIPFQSAFFDFVIVADAIAHQPRPERLAVEASRVIKDDGRVLALGEQVGRGGANILSGGDPRREGRSLSLTDFAGIFAEGDMEMDCLFADASPPGKKDGIMAKFRHQWRAKSSNEPRLLVGRHKKSIELPRMPWDNKPYEEEQNDTHRGT